MFCCRRIYNCCRPICPPREITRTVFIRQTPTGVLAVAQFDGVTATNTPIVLTETISAPAGQTNILLNTANNNVNVTPGTYLIRYGSTATSTSTTVPSLTLAFNGTGDSSTTRTGVANGTSTINGEYVEVFDNAGTIGLNSNQSADVTYDNNYLIIQKLL